MTLHRMIWQAKEACEFTVLQEGEAFEYKATPVVSNYWFGNTVGLFSRNSQAFGYWRSSNTCDLITAWRVAQMLPCIVTMRNGLGGYDSTMCGLVLAMQGDRNEDRMRERAKDMGMTADTFEAELQRLKALWPTAIELCSMWDRLPIEAQDKLVSTIRKAFDEGNMKQTQELVNRIEKAELRLRSLAEQKQYEDSLIEKGLSTDSSFRQLLADIGVTNLVYTLGCGDFGEPSHFSFENLDQAIMRELIGSRAYCSAVPLITTSMQPDDPAAHHSRGGGGVTMYWSDFGEAGAPRIKVESDVIEVISVSWDRVTERFMLTLRPLGLSKRDDSQDTKMSIESIRDLIGVKTGKTAPWLRKHRRLFGRPI